MAPTLNATAKTLGFDIDYKRLLQEFDSRGTLVRAFYYTAIVEGQEFSSIRPLVDWLDYNGYTVVTKSAKEFTDASGRRKVKGNMDIELAVNAMDLARACRRDRVVFRRWRFPFLGGVGAASRRQGHRGLHDFEPAADDRRRVAATSRRFHRSRRTEAQNQPRSIGASCLTGASANDAAVLAASGSAETGVCGPRYPLRRSGSVTE